MQWYRIQQYNHKRQQIGPRPGKKPTRGKPFQIFFFNISSWKVFSRVYNDPNTYAVKNIQIISIDLHIHNIKKHRSNGSLKSTDINWKILDLNPGCYQRLIAKFFHWADEVWKHCARTWIWPHSYLLRKTLSHDLKTLCP